MPKGGIKEVSSLKFVGRQELFGKYCSGAEFLGFGLDSLFLVVVFVRLVG